MPHLSIFIAICIANTVAWLIAIYSENGVRNLLWNVIFGTVGTLLLGLIISLVEPPYPTAILLFGGPICALLMIWAGHAVKRRLLGSRLPQPNTDEH
jgi:hypothetical protein